MNLYANMHSSWTDNSARKVVSLYCDKLKSTFKFNSRKLGCQINKSMVLYIAEGWSISTFKCSEFVFFLIQAGKIHSLPTQEIVLIRT